MPDLYTMIAWAIAGLAFVLGVQFLGPAGLLAALVVAVCLLALAATAAANRARRRLARPDPRFRATDEVFRDPASGRQTRVFVDPTTGERRYWKDS
jgi:membrane protein implicated in regulation of membrane protease activity